MFSPLQRFGQFRALGRSISTATVRLRLSREKYINKVQLLGRVGMEPRTYGSEKRLVSFPLATSFNFKVTNDDGSVTESSRTNWHLINIRFPNLQDYVLNYVFKGSRILVNGRLEYSHTKTREGADKELAVVVVDDLIIMSSPRAAESQASNDEELEGVKGQTEL